MKITRAEIALRMDKECGNEDVVVFPGTIYFTGADGKEYPVNFCAYEGEVDKANPCLLHFEGREPDDETFPGLHEITQHFDTVTGIRECYVDKYGYQDIGIVSMEKLELILTGVGDLEETPCFAFEPLPGGDAVRCIAKENLLASIGEFVYED